MARVLIPLGLAVALILGLAATVGTLAYGNEPPRDGRLEIDGLGGPVTVSWSDSGHVQIEAGTEADLAAGLGYAHAADHGWAAMLWRQAARGTLAEWFGDEGRPLDLHARTLGLRALARQTYESLPEADRALLDAYALGVNRALAEPGVVQGDAFIVSGVTPDPWVPWDALAVERLHLYLAGPPLTADSAWRAARPDSTIGRFVEADSSFRAFLGVSEGATDRVYVIGADADRTLVRHVSAGRSALSLFAPAVLRVGDTEAVALTIPGTLASPSGWAGGLGWGLLLGDPLVLEPYVGAAPPPVHSRVVERDGDETLLSVARDSSGLVLRPGRLRTEADTLAEADSAAATGWRVRWRGFRLGADLGAFRALRGGRLGAPRLLDGAGLAATTGEVRALGAPPVTVRGSRGTLVARDTSARLAARVLLQPDSADAMRDLKSGTASVWAQDYVRDLLGALGARDSLPDAVQIPYAYLLGWDGAYDPAAIAPSVFEMWLSAHRDFTGHLPDPADSLDTALLPYTLRIARAELRDRYGTLPYGWRWGDLHATPTYPVLQRWQTAAARTFRRPLGPAGGHPLALQPGPSLVFEDAASGAAAWSVWTRLGDGRTRIVAPTMRPSLDDLHLRAGGDGGSLVLDPGAPLPRQRLLLAPPE